MPYYKNKTVYRQPITLGGKRFVINPEDIVHVDRELDLNIYTFLEKTAETKNAKKPTPLRRRRKINAASKDTVDSLQKELISLKKELEQRLLETDSEEQINALKEQVENYKKNSISRTEATNLLTKAFNETPQIEPAELNDMAEDVSELKEKLERIAENDIIIDLSERAENMEKGQETVLRRLEIIKKVIQNIEDVLYGELIDEDGGLSDDDVVVVDDVNGDE